MQKTLKNSLANHKDTDTLDIDAGAGWHIAGLWTFIGSLPIPFVLHRFLNWNTSQIGMVFMLCLAALIIVQFEAFRRSNGILRPIALASTLFYGLFLYNIIPQ